MAHIVHTAAGRRCQSSKGKFVKLSRCGGGLGAVHRKHRKSRKSSRKHRGMGLAGLCTVCTTRGSKQTCSRVRTQKTFKHGVTVRNVVSERKRAAGAKRGASMASRFRAANSACGHKGLKKSAFNACKKRVLGGLKKRTRKHGRKAA